MFVLKLKGKGEAYLHVSYRHTHTGAHVDLNAVDIDDATVFFTEPRMEKWYTPEMRANTEKVEVTRTITPVGGPHAVP